MAKKLTDEQRKQIELRLKMTHDLAALEKKWSEEVEDYEIEEIAVERRDIPPPPSPEINKYNPDGIHDIITFTTHPYFLGQTLHPWQSLILKLLYMGSEGNQNLKIEKKSNTKTCNGCVWEYSRKKEEEVAKLWIDSQVSRRTFLPVENSPCLKCTRFDCTIRDAIFNSLQSSAKTLAEERKYERLRDVQKEDKYECEEDLLDSSEFKQEIRKQVENKLGNKFNELLLVLGRRSGKSLLVSIIALYEIYKLLSMKHPQKRYNLLDFDEISVLNVAVNEKQSKIGIFTKIKPMALSSPYFANYIGKPLELEIKFLTENDRKENERRKALGIAEIDGTIICRCGHSNAAGLVGGTNWVVIMDEVASMSSETGESGIDYRLYEELAPTIATFGDDGKVMLISNPHGPEGLLYDLYENRKTDPSTLIMQLPTWLTNPSVPMDWLDSQKAKNPMSFPMQYGAEFGDNATDPFMDPDIIDRAFHIRPTTRAESRAPLIEYYCHVDPASSSDDYALAVSHAMPSTIFGKPPAVMIDHIHYWEPGPKTKINSADVEEYIIRLNNIFKFAQVSFDTWNSQSAIANLQNAGVRAVCKPFNKSYQEMIYGTTFELFAENRIFIYNINTIYVDPVTKKSYNLQEVDRTKLQFKMLQKKWKSNGFKIEALSGYHDDIPDCIAAVAYECLNNKMSQTLPKSRTVYMGS